MEFDGSICIAENDSLILEMFQEAMVYDLRLVLGTNSSQEFLLSLGYAQPIEGLLDLIGNIFPLVLNLLGGTEIVVDVVKVDVSKIASPLGHWAFDEVFVGSEPELFHPFRLFLHLRNLFDSLS